MIRLVGWRVVRRYAWRLNALRLTAGRFLSAALLLGCSSQAVDSSDEPAGGTGGTGVVSQSVTLSDIYTPKLKVEVSATALAFNPTSEGELWLSLRQFPSGKPCTLDDDSGCAALPGVMAVLTDATAAVPVGVVKEDGNSWHFMRRPTAIAWGEGPVFASCGEALTDNYEDDDTPYAGPALWSSDPAIFGVKPLPTQNGTHIDMLHETPYCMGLTHESGNAFWAFNGLAGSLDRVDFHAPHAVGGEDHDDGEVHRYIAGQLLREPEVPSHIVYDRQRKLVYVADTGHGRVLSVDPSTSVAGGDIAVYEKLEGGSGFMDGASVKTLVPPGVLQKPSGVTLIDDALYVTDNATSRIYSFDINGQPLKILDTGLPPGSLAGIAMGPDALLYVTNLLTGGVHRVELTAP
jgi:hypothetical protein